MTELTGADRSKDVLAALERDFPSHLERIRDFVRFPSISASGEGMEDTARAVQQMLADIGVHGELVETPGYPIVFGELDAGKPKTLLIYGMYDVQPADEEGWMVPPFSGEIVDLEGLGPSVVSRGVFNTKAPLRSIFNVLRAIVDLDEVPVNLKFIIEGEEERGSKHLPSFIDQYRDRLSADAVLFPFYCQDSSGKPVVYLGVKGLLCLELSSKGGVYPGTPRRSVHSSYAAWVGSPVWRLVQALATLIDRGERITVDGFYDDIAPPSREDRELLDRLAETIDLDRIRWEFDIPEFKIDGNPRQVIETYLFSPTLNIAGIVAGYSGTGVKTVLPAEAMAKIDIRLIPDMTVESTLERLSAHLDRRGFQDIEVQIVSAYEQARTSVQEDISQALIGSIRSQGLEPEIWPHIGGSAPFYLFTDRLRLPLVMGGLGHGGRAHGVNEYATVAGMKAFEQWLATFLYGYAGNEKTKSREE